MPAPLVVPASPSTPVTPRSAVLIGNYWRASHHLEGGDTARWEDGASRSELARSGGSMRRQYLANSGNVGSNSEQNQEVMRQEEIRREEVRQEEGRDEAGPVPSKPGEIGYSVPSSKSLDRTGSQGSTTRSTRDGLGSPNVPSSRRITELRTGFIAPRIVPLSRSSIPVDASSDDVATRRISAPSPPNTPNSTRSTSASEPPKPAFDTVWQLFAKTVFVVFLNCVLFACTLAAFITVQNRVSAGSSSASGGDGQVVNDQGNSTGTSSESTASSVASPYLASIFVVGLIFEAWLLWGALRRLYHRLGLYLDQRYPVHLPDESDPDADPPPPPRPLPLWAKLLSLKPTAIRPPPLPTYTAVLTMIRGTRSGAARGTGDPEDQEVIRNLAIGQGRAAPAFGGDEFRSSTILLAGPLKRNSSGSILPVSAVTAGSPAMRSGSLMRRLSQRLSYRMSWRSSDGATTANGTPPGSPMVERRRKEPTVEEEKEVARHMAVDVDVVAARVTVPPATAQPMGSSSRRAHDRDGAVSF